MLYQGWKRGYYSRRTFIAICLLLLLAYSARTLDRNPDWDNQLDLFKSALEVCPNSGKVLFNYGAEMEMAGHEEIARIHYERAFRISESYDGVSFVTSTRARSKKLTPFCLGCSTTGEDMAETKQPYQVIGVLQDHHQPQPQDLERIRLSRCSVHHVEAWAHGEGYRVLLIRRQHHQPWHQILR